jgi:hypothetical protein
MSLEIQNGSFEEKGHIYRDAQGRKVLSVTQVLQLMGLVNYDFIREEILQRKSQIGIAVHKSIEYLCEGALDWDTVDPAAMPYVVGAESWMREMAFVSEKREQAGIATINGMSFGYAYDHKGKMRYKGRERQVILDLKTCSASSPSWALQTAGYALAENPNSPASLLRVVTQLLPDGRVKPIYFEDLQDYRTFQYMLYCAIWKTNHGYKLEREEEAA